MAFVVREKLNALNDAFKEVHSLISRTRIHTKHSDMHWNVYGTIQNSISQKSNPKTLFLESHCVPWIQTYGFSMGFHGEQGGELIHATVAKLERRGMAVRNVDQHLKAIMESQLLQTAPELLSIEPPIKRRKKKTMFKRLISLP